MSSVRTRKTFRFTGFLMLSLLVLFVFDQLLVNAKRVNADIISLDLTFEDHDRGVWAVVFSPIGDLVASSGIDSSVKIWQRSNGLVTQSLEHPDGVPALAFSPDGNFIASASEDATFKIWKLSR